MYKVEVSIRSLVNNTSKSSLICKREFRRVKATQQITFSLYWTLMHCTSCAFGELDNPSFQSYGRIDSWPTSSFIFFLPVEAGM